MNGGKKHPLWTCKQSIIKVRDREILIPCNLPIGGNYVRPVSPAQKFLARILIKPYRLRNELLVDGFIEKNITKWIRRFTTANDVILDVGCGDMRFYKYILPQQFYYAFDISVNEFFLEDKLKAKNKNLHFALASATAIPLDSNMIDIGICTEVLDHIPDYERALKEIARVIKANGVFLVSISNNFCHKYSVKGAHAHHHNAWRYEEFLNIAKVNGFDLIHGFLIGKWLHLPLWLTKTSYQLPLRSEKEFYNSYFLYAFRLNKPKE